MATFGKIGARPLLTRRFTAKDYVQDGLIFQVDAIENVGYGVHDPCATTWKDLIGGNSFNLPSGSIWGEDYLVLGSGNCYINLDFGPPELYAAGDIHFWSVHETIDFNDSISIVLGGINWFAGGLISIGPAWGKANIWNNLCSYNGASNVAWPNYPNGITKVQSDAVLECVGYINSIDETKASGFTALNLEKKRVWMPPETSNTSFLYNSRNSTSVYYRRSLISGSLAKRKSILMYNRVLTDEERLWNFRTHCIRFHLSGEPV